MWTYRTRLTAIAAAMLVAACGGGGGGDGPTPPPPPSLVKISLANQDAVARASIASIVPFFNVPMLMVSPSPERVTTAHAMAPPHNGMNQLLKRSLAMATQPAAAGVVRALTERSNEFQCPVSGTVTVTWNDRDESNTLTGGDSQSFAFSACSFEPGSSINGSYALGFSAVSETPTMVDYRGSWSFDKLVMLEQGSSMTLNGVWAFRLTGTLVTEGIDTLGTYTIGGGGFSAVATGGVFGFNDAFSYRAGYVLTERDFTPNTAGVAYTEQITADGRFGSAALGGDLDLTTLQPFKSTYTDPEGDIFPTEGQMLATGLDDTRISLTATKSIEVQMDVCDDGDGEWEVTKMVRWDWLLS